MDSLGAYVAAWLWLGCVFMVAGGVLMICALVALWRMVRS